MNPQETSIKHSALGWVKKSIDDNLSEIEVDLKGYIEDEDESLLEAVKGRLDMIQGVLMMIEQYGAAMLTEEMVALIDQSFRVWSENNCTDLTFQYSGETDQAGGFDAAHHLFDHA